MNPYESLPKKAFWRPSVADTGFLGLTELCSPAFRLARSDRVFTMGSCFAQHIGNWLKGAGYNWIDCEPAPPMMIPATRRRFQYGIFSARTGNIYSVSLMDQWLRWCLDPETADTEAWQDADGRWYDPARPTVEPEGFGSADEMLRARHGLLARMRAALADTDVFIFTLGLTEQWINRESGLVYALCPGTAHGVFDPARHAFHNDDYVAVTEALASVHERLRGLNPAMKMILTVSPVPLIATAQPDAHVLVSTTHSKSVLRAAAGAFAAARDGVEYFPSYELVTASVTRGALFGPNLRDVTPEGVRFVMQHFERAFTDTDAETDAAEPVQAGASAQGGARRREPAAAAAAEVVCDEYILDYYDDV